MNAGRIASVSIKLIEVVMGRAKGFVCTRKGEGATQTPRPGFVFPKEL